MRISLSREPGLAQRYTLSIGPDGSYSDVELMVFRSETIDERYHSSVTGVSVRAAPRRGGGRRA